ncbi:MAG TPA: helicase-associated domain-containing protein, partial [Myxococcota bacterium]|nr:helicase-associated domain-containing protein [Myxococcota bacterium]
DDAPRADERGRSDERPRGGRRAQAELEGPSVATPSSGRNPHRKRSSRARRGQPGSVAGRRRNINRVHMRTLEEWLGKLPESLLANLYRGLGGQPRKVPSTDRMIQLAVRAITQGSRLGALLKQLQERDRQALAALLQCGGVAHADELHRELALTLGGHEREWKKIMAVLAERGIVMASAQQDEHFFYVVPEVLTDGLLEALATEMSLPTFDHPDVRVIEHRPFAPPLDFSVTTLATYLAQHSVRLTQRHDVFRAHQEALDAFFRQLWESGSELFNFHLDFLMMHGMVELRGDHLALDRDVMEEWLQLEPEDQRDLIFRALDRRFEMAEWVLWAVHAAGAGWVAERPLVSLYRHWKRGRDWRHRLKSGNFAPTRTSERDSYAFSPLVQCGLLEMGQWGQEKFYRLTSRATALLAPAADDGFQQFYLTPDFKLMAPAGLAPILLFRLGEIAELTGCDRANTYRITEDSVNAALEAGWRRDDVLQFLRDNSMQGLPDNIEATLKGWIGHRGDVEFHDLLLITVHRSQIRRLESNRRVKPYILHRFAPGMYAVDRTKKDELARLLADLGFSPSRETRSYPGNPETVEARANLHKLLGEARDAVADPGEREGGLIDPGQLHPVPGTRVPTSSSEPDIPPPVTPQQARAVLDEAIGRDANVEMVYQARNGQRLNFVVRPERLTFRGDSPVLVGTDMGDNERRTYVLENIERLRIQEDG